MSRATVSGLDIDAIEARRASAAAWAVADLPPYDQWDEAIGEATAHVQRLVHDGAALCAEVRALRKLLGPVQEAARVVSALRAEGYRGGEGRLDDAMEVLRRAALATLAPEQIAAMAEQQGGECSATGRRKP